MSTRSSQQLPTPRTTPTGKAWVVLLVVQFVLLISLLPKIWPLNPPFQRMADIRELKMAAPAKVATSGKTPSVRPSAPKKDDDGTSNPPTFEGFGFKPPVPGGLQHSDVEWCPGSNEPLHEELERVPESQNVLFLAGAQKAGTSWMWSALMTHPAFIAPDRDHLGNADPGHTKEIHFFDAWPMLPQNKFLPRFFNDTQESSTGGPADHVHVDATPAYLHSSAFAPRAKAVAPHARIVVVLRDPVARAYSAWKMNTRNMKRKESDQQRWRGKDGVRPRAQCAPGLPQCPGETFAIDVQEELEHLEKLGCLFNEPNTDKTWHDCFRCNFRIAKKVPCSELPEDGDELMKQHCSMLDGVGLLSVSNYAAQIAWLLSFFPPEQILVVASQQLRDEEKAVETLNRVLELTGVEGAEPFTVEMIESVVGFNGRYSTTLEDDEAEAVLQLRDVFEKPMRDLEHLLALHGLDESLEWLTPEI